MVNGELGVSDGFRELLGPANGPEEILDGTPDATYLIGRIAPQRLTGSNGDPVDADSDEAGTDVGDAEDSRGGRGVPVTAVEETGTGGDDDSTEDAPQLRGLMIPASMGLRCQIPEDLAWFTVTASWGVYEPFGKEEGDDSSPRRRYKRTPVEITTTIKVTDLGAQTAAFPLRGKVVLRVDQHLRAGSGCRLIEIVACNDQVTPPKIPVDAWLYQTKLVVQADGAEVFLPVLDPLEDTWNEPDDELRRLQLQYRNRLEFAIGRTCSVDWTVADGSRRATEVRTTWLPVSETPQVTAEEVSGALLDMAELAEASPDAIRAGLEPIVREYAEWLDGEQAAGRDTAGPLARRRGRCGRRGGTCCPAACATA